MRHGRVRSLYRTPRRKTSHLMPSSCPTSRRAGDHNDRRPRHGDRASPSSRILHRTRRGTVRVLHSGNDSDRLRDSQNETEHHRGRDQTLPFREPLQMYRIPATAASYLACEQENELSIEPELVAGRLSRNLVIVMVKKCGDWRIALRSYDGESLRPHQLVICTTCVSAMKFPRQKLRFVHCARDQEMISSGLIPFNFAFVMR